MAESSTTIMKMKTNDISQKTQLMHAFRTGALIIGVIAMFFLLIQTIPSLSGGGEKNTAKKEKNTASQAIVSADTSRDTVDMKTTEQKHLSDSVLIKDIRFATKGDGAVRQVDVNGKMVDPVVVKLAAFENHDFVLRDEPRLTGFKAKEDNVLAPQRSHFRAQTFPLANLGNDYFRAGSTDTRVSISDSGGRV